MSQRAVHLLTEAMANPQPQRLGNETKPALFADSMLRQQAEKLDLRPKSQHLEGPVTKRQKQNHDEASLSGYLADQLCRLVEIEPDSDMDELEPRILFVALGCLTT